MKISEEQRRAIGAAVLDVLGADHVIPPERIVGLHTSCDVLTITVVVPCSWLKGRRAQGQKRPQKAAPIETVRRKS